MNKKRFDDKPTKSVLVSDKKSIWEKIFGDKHLIFLIFSFFIPSALQQLITTSVTYVDTFFIAGFAPNNIIVDNVTQVVDNAGSIAKTSVGIATSIIYFPVMVLLGVASGIGLVTAQYYGSKDKNKLQQTIIYKILVGLVLVLPLVILMMVIPDRLVAVSRNVYNPVGTSKLISELSSTYLFWSGPSFFMILLVYTLGYSYREIGKPKFPLIASIVSVSVNIILDPLLIVFETELNDAVRNIAIATMISRFIEFVVMVICIYVKKEHYLMISKIRLDWNTFKVTMKNSIQAILNDSLYGFATLFLVICLLVYNEDDHDAFTTVSIIIQFSSVIFPGMAASCAVLVGSELGRNNIKEAKKNSYYLLVWGSIISLFFALILLILSLFINPILSPPPSVGTPEYIVWQKNQILAQKAEWVMMPVIFSQGVFSILYYSIKAGGSKIIFFTDGFVMSIWCIIIGPLVYTNTINPKTMSSLTMFTLVELNQIAKAICAGFFYKYSNWAINITDNLNTNNSIQNI